MMVEEGKEVELEEIEELERHYRFYFPTYTQRCLTEAVKRIKYVNIHMYTCTHATPMRTHTVIRVGAVTGDGRAIPSV